MLELTASAAAGERGGACTERTRTWANVRAAAVRFGLNTGRGARGARKNSSVQPPSYKAPTQPQRGLKKLFFFFGVEALCVQDLASGSLQHGSTRHSSPGAWPLRCQPLALGLGAFCSSLFMGSEAREQLISFPASWVYVCWLSLAFPSL